MGGGWNGPRYGTTAENISMKPWLLFTQTHRNRQGLEVDKVYTHTNTHTPSWLCVRRGPRRNDCSTNKHTQRPDHGFSVALSRAPRGKWLTAGLRQGKYKVSCEH